MWLWCEAKCVMVGRVLFEAECLFGGRVLVRLSVCAWHSGRGEKREVLLLL